MRAYRLILPFLFLIACKTASLTSSTSDIYEEDLSYLRPNLETKTSEETPASKPIAIDKNPTFEGNIKARLDTVNKVIVERNRTVKYVEGYTIQVYSGNNREAATEARDLVLQYDITLLPEISYYQPTYKVKVGQYTNRLQAHKAYESMKAQFPRALLIPERIKIDND